jgi:hypothetical protein
MNPHSHKIIPKYFKMKKLILIGFIFLYINSSLVMSCTTPAEKVEKAQAKVDKANGVLDAVNDAYLTDIETYRKGAFDKIVANDLAIKEFRARIEAQKRDAKANYVKKITELEQKNTDLKKKMDDYKASNKEKWDIFKAEFSHDMDALGQAFKDLTVKNVQ